MSFVSGAPAFTTKVIVRDGRKNGTVIIERHSSLEGKSEVSFVDLNPDNQQVRHSENCTCDTPPDPSDRVYIPLYTGLAASFDESEYVGSNVQIEEMSDDFDAAEDQGDELPNDSELVHQDSDLNNTHAEGQSDEKSDLETEYGTDSDQPD
jgi:hypothetical protein